MLIFSDLALDLMTMTMDFFHKYARWIAVIMVLAFLITGYFFALSGPIAGR